MAGSKIAEKMKVRTSQSTKESPKKTTKRLSAKSRKPEEAGKKTRKHPRFGKRPIDAMFPLYIHRVLKQVHPEMKLSMKAITILNSFAVDMMERLCGEMPMLMQGRHTMASRDVQSAVRLQLPGELAKHAISEGTKALAKYTQAKN